MAGSVGLFDAALNYLWGNRRKELKTAEDLVKLDDSKLLSGARESGLISDVGYHRVDHIRFMRNYDSVTHPDQVALTGRQLGAPASRTSPSGQLTNDATHLTSHQNERQMSVTSVISASRYRP